MAEHDLTSRIAPHLDRHLVFPLLEFLQERQLYADEEILKAKINLLSQTNMVDYAMDIHKSLYHTEEVPQDMMDRRAEVVGRLKSLEESAAPLISFLQNAANVQELRPDKLYNLQMLNDRFQIGQEQIEALYQYAKFQFECGNYSGAADYLYHYRDLCTNSDRSLSALWGKLAAEILMQNWAIALEELNRLKEIIDSKVNLFLLKKYLNAIQTNANHLLRYVATAVIVSKRRWNMIKELIKVIQQENHLFKDPITEFLECLYINYDFEGAQQKLQECEHVILNDPFLGKRVEDANFSTVPLKDEFLENARLFIFETYCRIHQCIDIGMLAEKLNMNYDEAENWIMNLVQNAKLEAKIDSVSGTVIMETSNVNVYEQLIETMKNLNTRTYLLAKSLVDQTPQSAR
ncbi:hypothetical protein KFK09_000875 [Dendrobium nobile]|uniref:Eukaryotic translation initiation factor 3 subunit E n=1 Tax=Dendrobium nobile TaxID=94219 RepID=A0A8T3CD33_DENNO|nr:hypothetical protein KFK09_000875 [Dendrobium nobile]